MTYWQIASGEGRRDYKDRFLEHGIAFVGERYAPRMRQVEVGDVVVLKKGITKILAVGEVVERDGRHVGVGDKEWLRDFDGWDLPAYCHVQWHQPSQPERVTGLAQDAIARLKKPQLQDIVDDLLQVAPIESLQEEPRPTRKVEDGEILDFLIREGLSPTAAENLTVAFHRVRRLAHYYYYHCNWKDIKEHETRTFLIIPILLALGWSEQQIKIELNLKRVGTADIACFSKPYRRDHKDEPNNHECALIIETKNFDSGLDEVRKQAIRYAATFPSCKAVIVSNGYCYKAFKRTGIGTAGFSRMPSAYLNLLRPRDAYPLDPDHVEGALETLRLLLPHSWR